MTQGPQRVRIAAKAVIIYEGQLLALQVRDLLHRDRSYHCLPGGGQQPGENLHEALMRECKEEIGVDVRVGELLFARDYIGPNHAHAAVDGQFHQVELIFACKLKEEGFADVGRGAAPDARQIGVDWIPLEQLPDINFRPQALVSPLQALAAGASGDLVRSVGPAYLGDVD